MRIFLCLFFTDNFFVIAQIREGKVGHLRSSDEGGKKPTKYGVGKTEKRLFGWSRRMGE
jgi:hypothetical protein